MKKNFSAAEYARLSAFLRGYLHEDFKSEYGSPVGALADFLKSASAAESAALSGELSAFVKFAADVPFSQAQEWWTRELGSAWLPADMNAILKLAKEFKKKAR